MNLAQLATQADGDGIGLAVGGALVVVIAVVAVVLLVLFVAAIVSILRNQGLRPGERLAWILIVLFLQLIGPLLWFAVGRRAAER